MAENNSTINKSNNNSGFDIDLMDLEDISLEELDGFDGIDLDNLEVDDIDFDDIDVTSLDAEINVKQDTSKAVSNDFDFENLLGEDAPKEEIKMTEEEAIEETKQLTENIDEFLNSINLGDDASLDNEVSIDSESVEEAVKEDNAMVEESAKEAVEEPTVDAMDEIFADADASMASDMNETANSSELENFLASLDDLEDAATSSLMDSDEDYSSAGDDLDDLLQQSMEMGLESGELSDIEDIEDLDFKKEKKGFKLPKLFGKKKAKEGNLDVDFIDSLADEEKAEKSGKKSLKEILFGEPDEDDIEEEKYFAEKKAEQETKKAEKAEAKAAKKAEQEEKKKEEQAAKDKAAKEKAKEKAEKKSAAEEAYLLELEALGKPVSKVVTIIIFALFVLLAVGVIVGTKTYDYNKVIRKATDYYERQRYRLAYDEIAGVNVKSKDEELRDKIYTVMYVERLYESYENNIKLGRTEKALDALIRGLQKYDEHYEEAVELGIVDDINVCRQKIVSSLWTTYSIKEPDAYELMKLQGQDYRKALDAYCIGVTKVGE